MIVSDGGRTGSSQKPLRRNGRIIRFPSRSRRTGCSARTMRCRAAGATVPIPRPEYSPARGRIRLRHLGYFVFDVFAFSHIRFRSIGRKAINFSPGHTGGSAVSTLRTNPVLICRRGGRNLLRIAQKPETAERGIARAAVAERSATRKGKNHLSEQAVRDRSGNGRPPHILSEKEEYIGLKMKYLRKNTIFASQWFPRRRIPVRRAGINRECGRIGNSNRCCMSLPCAGRSVFCRVKKF